MCTSVEKHIYEDLKIGSTYERQHVVLTSFRTFISSSVYFYNWSNYRSLSSRLHCRRGSKKIVRVRIRNNLWDTVHSDLDRDNARKNSQWL